MWAGGADPIRTDAGSSGDDDIDLEHLRALLSAWRAAFGSAPVTLADAVDATRPPGGNLPSVVLPENVKRELAQAFIAVHPRHDDRYTAASLRYYFRHHHGRPVDVRGDTSQSMTPSDTLRLEIANPRTGTSKVASWHVLDGVAPNGENPPQAQDHGTSLFDSI